MKAYFLSITLTIGALCANGQNLEWAVSLNGPQNDQVKYLDVDGNSDIILIGYARENFDIDPSANERLINQNGKPFKSNAYVAKFSDEGALKWAVEFGDTATSTNPQYAGAIDSENNIIFAGTFEDSVDFDPGTGNHVLHKERRINRFVTKLSTSGDIVFATKITADDNLTINEIISDNEGNIYVAGIFGDQGAVDFDPTEDSLLVSSKNGWDVFIAKYTKLGEVSWVKTFKGTGDQFVDAMAVNSNGNLLLSGHFQYEIELNFEPIVIRSDGRGTLDLDGYVVEMDSNGKILLHRHVSSYGDIYHLKVYLGELDTAYLSASFTYDIDLDLDEDEVILNSPSLNFRNGVYAKYTPDWKLVHHNHFVGETSVYLYNIDVNSKNEVIAMGSFTENVRFDSIRTNEELFGNGSFDVFLTTFDAAGRLKCARSFGSRDRELPLAIKLVDDNTFVFAGDFIGDLDMDPTTGSAVLKNGGVGNDASLALYSMCDDGVYTTSIEPQSTARLNAYPNPVRDYLNIDHVARPSSFQVADIMGVTVMKGTLELGANQIDFSVMNPGVYVLYTEQGQMKLVVE